MNLYENMYKWFIIGRINEYLFKQRIDKVIISLYDIDANLKRLHALDGSEML